MMGTIPELIVKRVFTYLLRRCFGQYLETFTHDEFTINYNKGKAVVENVALKVEALNSLLVDYNLPFELLSGAIDRVIIEIPWTAPFTENCVIEFHGVHLVVQLKKCAEDVSMFASMFESMTSSLQMAEECLACELDNEPEFEAATRTESVQTIVEAIDTVFSRMKIKFIDTSIRVENVLENSNTGVALEIKIKRADCFDEAGVEPVSSGDKNINSADRNAYQFSAYCVKKCLFEGISLYTAQFSAAMRDVNQEHCSSSMLSPGSPEMPPQHSSLLTQKDEDVVHIEPVLISKIPGQQQLRLKLKQNDSIVGPKVDIEISLGIFNLFLSPYQVFMLIELANGLTKPGSYNNRSADTYHPAANNRPMQDSDFALVQQELLKQQEKLNLPSKSLQNRHGWSSHSMDESDEEFHLMKMENRVAAVEIPLITEDLESSCSSVGSERMYTVYSNSADGSNLKKSPKVKGSNIQHLLSDPLTESTQIHLSCSSLCIVLLHDHRWTAMPSGIDDNATDCDKNLTDFMSLGNMAEKFFSDLAAVSLEGLNFKDFAVVRAKFSKLIQTNHLRFIASGVTMEVSEKTSSLQRIFATSLTLLDLEVLECLFNAVNKDSSQLPTYTELVTFKHERLKTASPNGEFSQPCLKIKYDRCDYGVQFRMLKQPANKLVFHMAPVALDIDISLMDRIQTLLNPDLTFIRKNRNKNSFQFDWGVDSDMNQQPPPKTEVRFSSSFVLVNLRFPIPDLRVYIDRLPWWKQNLRTETLMMELTDASLCFVVDSEQVDQTIELQCRDFHGLFNISPNEEPISFIRVSVDPEAEKTERDDCFDWPRLVLHKIPQSTALNMDSELHPKMEDNGYMSLNQEAAVQSLIANMTKAPSPFATNSVAFGSKLSGNSSPSNKKDGNGCHDEIITPAEKQKILSFIEGIMDRSQYVFDFNLPTVNIVLPDKNFFELLYNRLGSDLLLWESSPAISVNSFETTGPMSSILDVELQPLKDHASYLSFRSCNANYDSNSESDDDVTPFYSVHDYRQKQNEMQRDSADNHKLTKLAVNMTIVKGSIMIHCPLRDSSDNISIDECGRLQLCVEDCKFFVASSYKGNPRESYICLLSNKGRLYHDRSIPICTSRSIVQPFASGQMRNPNVVIYPSGSGVPITHDAVIGKGGDSIDVLSIAVHVVVDLKQQMKTFKMAIGVSGSTLRHYMCPSTELWLNQFSDFVNVKDYPILGYEPSSVVVELHLHLMNCSIDYRPLHLPLRAFLTVENFDLSTNITASTDTSLLRIISEELCLFLSNDIKAQQVDLKKGYVCVLDTGLIDLSVRVTNGKGKSEPRFEMCASNNMINIYTCVDSYQALQKLILYLASYGDFASSPPETPVEPLEPPKKEIETNTNVSPSSIDNVHNLMAEAMKDCTPPKSTGTKTNVSDSESIDLDEEFCIIEDDPGVGVLPKNREPVIRVLTDEPIKIDYDFFKVPSEKIDVLKAPKSFPDPVLRHTLREMSVTWHLYGGSDFKDTKSPKRRIRINSVPEFRDSNLNHPKTDSDVSNVRIDAAKNTISFCKVTQLSGEFNTRTLRYSLEQVPMDYCREDEDSRSWIVKGGENRDQKVHVEFQLNKVRFQHEEYPEGSENSARDVLLIHDIEIRDKLESSDINKFLYQYSSESMPRQTHADMLEVKAISGSDPKQASQECALKISCKPLRLNIDQDTLNFLCDFFNVFSQETCPDTTSNVSSPDAKTGSIVGENPEAGTPAVSAMLSSTQSENINPVFFKRFSFSPDVLIRFDYKGKRVDMKQGAIQGLLMGLAELNCSQITLKRLSYRKGLLGWEKLISYAVNEWIQDIKKNQLSGVLAGIGPMHSFVQLLQGLKDLVWLPVEQYRKDGQIVRGLQRGASSFSTSTAAAFLELAGRLIAVIQGTAEVAYDMVSPGPSVANRLQGNVNQCRRTSQPADFREGMTSAFNVMKEGLGDTARTIMKTASIEHEHKGVRGALGGVLRQIPPATVKPIILSTEAACMMLGGAKHQLIPDAHKEAKDKWRTRHN